MYYFNNIQIILLINVQIQEQCENNRKILYVIIIVSKIQITSENSYLCVI